MYRGYHPAKRSAFQ